MRPDRSLGRINQSISGSTVRRGQLLASRGIPFPRRPARSPSGHEPVCGQARPRNRAAHDRPARSGQGCAGRRTVRRASSRRLRRGAPARAGPSNKGRANEPSSRPTTPATPATPAQTAPPNPRHPTRRNDKPVAPIPRRAQSWRTWPGSRKSKHGRGSDPPASDLSPGPRQSGPRRCSAPGSRLRNRPGSSSTCAGRWRRTRAGPRQPRWS